MGMIRLSSGPRLPCLRTARRLPEEAGLLFVFDRNINGVQILGFVRNYIYEASAKTVRGNLVFYQQL